MKLQRYSLHDVDTMDFILMHGAILCKDDDVEALEAENAALKAETERLRLNLNNHRVALNKNGAELDATYAALALMNAVAKTMDKEIEALKAESSKLKEALELISSLRGPFISEGDIAKCWDTVDEILNAQVVK